MNRIQFILLITFLGSYPQLYGQVPLEDSLQKELVEVTAQEGVFVHLNSSLLFPGEYLLYKVYVLKEPGDQLSEISKIAYVELVGENGHQVFIQKVALEEGMGQADFFVPTSVPSGNYKLVAYTNWMRNNQKSFFETDLTVLNPYQANQDALLKKGSTIQKAKIEQTENTANLELSMDKRQFANREKVTVELDPIGIEGVGANLSVSVRKTNEFRGFSTKKATEIQFSGPVGGGNKLFYIPEVRGELLSGTIIPYGSNNNLPLNDQKIALSILGKGNLPKVSATDSKGRFFFVLDKNRSREEAWIEVIGVGKDDFTIEMNQPAGVDTEVLRFKKFNLGPEMEEEIIQRSVYNQIENAYFGVKPDTLVNGQNDQDVMESRRETYDLDDYKRFKTIPETFVEIVNSAWIRKNSEGKEVFQVRSLTNSINMGQLPLVVIDGVNIQDHEELVYLAASKIQSIDIIRDKLYIGPAIYQGAVVVKTVEGDFADNFSRSYGKRLEIPSPEIQQRYFKQDYSDDSKEKDRIPDFRYQLFWEPDFKVRPEGSRFFFYTSDVDGDFEIVIEGFTHNGEPVSVQKTFTVQ